MIAQPDLIERAELQPASVLLPLALVIIDVRFSRDVIFAGRPVRTQAAYGRVLRVDPDAVLVMMMPLLARGENERRMARFVWDAAQVRWALAERLSAAGMEKPPAPFDKLTLERAALGVRLERHAASTAFAEAFARLEEVAPRFAPLPAFASLELGLGAAVSGKTAAALAALGDAIAAGCPEAPTAHAVRARLLLEQGDLDAAEAEVAALAAMPNAGLHSDGVAFPARWLKLHEAYLRGRCAAARGDDRRAEKALGASAKDGDDCARETERYQEKGADGEIVSVDVGAKVFLETTLDPQMNRRQRSHAARRVLAEIAAKRGAWEQVLTRLETLDAPGDELARARAFLALGREAEGAAALERAAAAGVVEAQEMLQERRRRAAIEVKPKALVPAEAVDLDDRVEHAKFGTGTVADVEISGGKAARVSVAFDDGSTRTVPAGAVRKVS